MKIYLAEKGLDKSWQESFEKNIKCKHCGSNARIAFVAYEDGNGKNLCDIHKQGKDGKLWLHDVSATAVYLCEKCLEATAEINQA
ncbi:MAG TPA: hypothetical protein ENI66_00515 [Candidatus Yonathbacteria bacterium]|nr:hypothetical protein [Candidatus Yonathbacteria bacterium]